LDANKNNKKHNSSNSSSYLVLSWEICGVADDGESEKREKSTALAALPT